MRESEHYELNLVEGTDKVNPLVQDVPNYETIDEAMYNNKCASIGIATELRTGTVHALTRQNEDAPVFRFTASSNYTSGDTFTVDGVQVSALLVDGTPLPNMAYIIGSEVLCVLKGTLITVFANRTTSSDSDRLGGKLPAYYATASDLDALESVVDAHTDQIGNLSKYEEGTVQRQSGVIGANTLRRFGNTVNIAFAVSGNTVPIATSVGIVPNAFRPAHDKFGVLTFASSSGFVTTLCKVASDGTITCPFASASTTPDSFTLAFEYNLG